jgi:vanillate O-demethylase monooxygenase subunit
MKYLRNAWYVAAWSLEVKPDRLLARTVLGEPLVFFRNAGGTVVALLDRCPHRFAALSKGKLQAGVLECGYHGLTFNGAGACVRNPHGATTSSLSVRTFAVCEAYDAIWLWGGDPATANSALLPELACANRSGGTRGQKGYLRMNAHYELVADNIMDLSHADFLHPDTLASGALTRTRAEVDVGKDQTVKIAWYPRNEVLGPNARKNLPDNPERADMWNEVTWRPPAVIETCTGETYAGRPHEEGSQRRALHTMTPETETTTHYFFARRMDFYPTGSAAAQFDIESTELFDAERHFFNLEDRPIIESQQSRLGGSDFWSLGPKLLPTDRGAAAARRLLQQMIEKETSGEVAVAPAGPTAS